MPPSEIIGVHQSDIIIRSAIMAAIDDLRANPWLLDYVFASLPKDDLTKDDYGQREIDQAKKWFMSTRIPVFISSTLDDMKFPCISINLLESGESETTLGDIHYVPQQDDGRVWPALSTSFNAVSYGPSTGLLEVPKAVGDSLILAPGMQVLDSVGRPHEIREVVDTYTVKIDPSAAEFRNAVIKGKQPSQIAAIESVHMKETYSIGSHAQGERVHLTYLHTLLVFCLHRYKMRLLEARGFERSVVSSSEFRLNDSFSATEVVYSRHLNITGHVTQVWPADITPKITATQSRLAIQDLETVEPAFDPADSSWIGEQDMISLAAGALQPRAAAPAPAPTPAPVSDLVAYWSMEDGANPSVVKDYGSGENNLQAQGVWPALVPGRLGLFAREFRPDPTTVTLVGSAAGPVPASVQDLFANGSYSFACWMKTFRGIGDTFQVVLAVTPDEPGSSTTALFNVFYDDQFHGLRAGYLDATVNLVPDSIPDNTWTHVAVTFEALLGDGVFRVYANGVKIAEETGWPPSGASSPNAKWNLGGAPFDTSGSHGGYAFTGQLDDVRIYNRKLSDQEVLTLANG